MPTKVECLVARMRAAGAVIPDDWEFHRIYGGRRMREAGCWSWFMRADSNIRFNIGSQYPVTLLLRAPVLSCTRSHSELGWDVDPEPVPASWPTYGVLWTEAPRDLTPGV